MDLEELEEVHQFKSKARKTQPRYPEHTISEGRVIWVDSPDGSLVAQWLTPDGRIEEL
jgi:hypothetical protein